MTSRVRSNRRPASTGKTLGKAPRLVENLVVLRESGQYDKMLMSGMIQQTCAMVRDLPGSDELRSAGIDIFENPGRYGANLRRAGGSRIVMFEREGTMYFCSMGSASKADANDENAFISELVKVIAQFRPQHVWAAAFTRLCRNAEFAGDLLKVMSEHVEELHCETLIKLSTPEGKMQFQLLAMIASTERDYIVRRHTAGRMQQWRNKRWIPIAYPSGYKLDKNRLILLDEESVTNVRKMLCVLADSTLTAKQMIKSLETLGITSQKIKETHGPDATVGDVRNPTEAIVTLVGWVDTYRTGRYTLLWPNPFPGVDNVAGVPVEEIDPEYYPNGALRLEYELPLPEGGWAEEATLAAIERRQSNKRTITGASTHKIVGPLAGFFRFTENDYQYAIVGKGNLYGLLRRVDEPKKRHFGWSSNADGRIEQVATFNRLNLHESITRGVIDAVTIGLPAELDVTRFQSQSDFPMLDQNSAHLRLLRRQLSESEKQLDRARRNARQCEDDEASQYFIDDVKRYDADIRRLTAEITACEKVKVKPLLNSSFETNASMVAYAMSALANTAQFGDQALRQALRTIISNESMTYTDKEVTWSLNLELPHPEGTVLLGPITGTVANLMRKGGPRSRRSFPRAK